MQSIWHGDESEALALLAAIDHWCRKDTDPEGEHCTYSPAGKRDHTCAGHKMLATEQRNIDALVFYRRIAECLRTEEFCANPTGAGKGK